MQISEVKIRFAKSSDMDSVLELIKELAVYEKAGHEVTNTAQQLVEDGFGNKPVFECLVAECDNNVIGFALFFTSYSTWKGACLYLEDLCVTERFRRFGIGKMLFDEILKTALSRKMKRLSWQVLEWNEPAIEFYKKYQANLDPEWINGRIVLE